MVYIEYHVRCSNLVQISELLVKILKDVSRSVIYYLWNNSLCYLQVTNVTIVMFGALARSDSSANYPTTIPPVANVSSGRGQNTLMELAGSSHFPKDKLGVLFTNKQLDKVGQMMVWESYLIYIILNSN